MGETRNAHRDLEGQPLAEHLLGKQGDERVTLMMALWEILL
jgi:hypothetical protein